MKREHIFAHYEQDASRYWKLREGGYATPQSVRQGEQVVFHISNSRSYYDIFVFREGAKRALVKEINDLQGQLQPVPELGYQNGFDWSETLTFDIPLDWPSGVYIASFATGQGMREILFVVRPKHPSAPLLLTIETNTYAAYNTVGGKCFFPYISTDRRHSELVSFERPLPPDIMGGFYAWDQFFTSWLDAEGYAVDYCTNADHDAEADLLDNYRAHLRIGHGEYTSRSECQQLQRFVAGGGNLLVFAGNSFWHLSETRNDGRQLYCAKTRYKEHPLGTPAEPGTSFLCALEHMRQRTIGVSYTACVNAKSSTPGEFIAPTSGEYGFFRVTEPDHWAFAGTGLGQGDEFGRADSIVGVECDGGDLEFSDGKARFTGLDGISPHYQIIALADAADAGLNRDLGIDQEQFYSTVAINETQFKGTVFTAATIEWAHGLYRNGGAVAQITRNVLDRLGR
ncbi:MAG: hypothetical protein GKR89_14605 [Candidatus Latescibacteria bacterium]|nr:hypothetical protein [Candidatus Latescibacterota bacterium]